MLKSLLVLVILVYAFTLILGGQRAASGISRLIARSLGFRLMALARLTLVVLFTLTDGFVTLVLMAYHAVTPLRQPMVGDDAAAFLHRLNDRVLRALM